MTTATKTKKSQSLTVLELMGTNIKEGQEAKVVTDNHLYGVTVKKQNGALVNVRTQQQLSLTSELLQTKFRLVSKDTELTVPAFIEAYKAGKTIRIEVGDDSREVCGSFTVPQYIRDLLQIRDEQIASDFIQDFVTMQELIEGKFYLVNS